uniref:NifB/NifX family molybdenum-iron cluster-binding protein n=1 Tax=uncultured Flavonifractor sp. TaxID=1193534 RepID=UPI00262EEE85|nr:NifB/NifX family molybdenum-iron cluster-binding protein [uncultured Flavonifractor sp.]
MKIAVASVGTEVGGHFGHCEHFRIYTAVDGKIMGEELVQNPEHKPGFLPGFLGDMGVEVVIAGGMGAHAVSLFGERNIQIVTGVQGDARTAVEQYLKGELKSTGVVCQHHDHDHEHHHEHHCGGHHE